MEQILLAYSLPKETVAAIMMLYKTRSQDRDTDYFYIVASVLKGNTLAPYLFIIFLVYVLRTFIDIMKYNGIKLAKEKTEDTPDKKK